MEKSIYKITNLVNQKSYIGQTNNIKRRFQEHRAAKIDANGTSKLLHLAIQKYGIENFIFEVIEENIVNYNEREIYWIQFYDTTNPNKGYNLTNGGDAPPILKGLANPNTTHTMDQVQQVKNLLLNSTLTSVEIANITQYDDSAIRRINIGEIWYDETLVYPLRKEITKNYQIDRAKAIIEDLQNTTMTQAEIAKKYKVGRSTVTAINRGQNHHQKDLIYPIRGKKEDQHSKTVLMLDLKTHQVLQEFSNAAEAAKYIGCSRSAIQLCCSGQTFSSAGYFWKYKDN